MFSFKTVNYFELILVCAQDSEGQGSQACCNPWGCKESDMNYQLINSNKIKGYFFLFHGVSKCSESAEKILVDGKLFFVNS